MPYTAITRLSDGLCWASILVRLAPNLTLNCPHSTFLGNSGASGCHNDTSFSRLSTILVWSGSSEGFPEIITEALAARIDSTNLFRKFHLCVERLCDQCCNCQATGHMLNLCKKSMPCIICRQMHNPEQCSRDQTFQHSYLEVFV